MSSSAQPTATSPSLIALEPRLRSLLPADLYASAWTDPTPGTLQRVYEHLRTLQRILYDYVPRHVSDTLPHPGEQGHTWQSGTLMFTDLAGFTALLEASASLGAAGADSLLGVLNAYFASMIEIVSKSGGDLLEFTGDALLAQFPDDPRYNSTTRAVRAGLRMQRAMVKNFSQIETPRGTFAFGMRVGIHSGRFLTADIGTPRRMEHVLLGEPVQDAKRAESAGQTGRVCLTEHAYEAVRDQFRFEPGQPGYQLVVDDLDESTLGQYDITLGKRRPPGGVLFDRSTASLLSAIEDWLPRVEPVAAYIPSSVLSLLVESAAERRITPDFPTPTVVFVTLLGLPELIDRAQPEEVPTLVTCFSRAFAQINAAVQRLDGVLKKVTYHLAGSDIVIYFGVPHAHTDDPLRGAHTALAIRDLIPRLPQPIVAGTPVQMRCRIGIACGPAFAAEIGEPRGRREFNVLGDTVNTAARLMGRAIENQILVTEGVFAATESHMHYNALGTVALKGKRAPTALYELLGHLD